MPEKHYAEIEVNVSCPYCGFPEQREYVLEGEEDETEWVYPTCGKCKRKYTIHLNLSIFLAATQENAYVPYEKGETQ